MIKLSATLADGRRLLLLGIESGNIEQLKRGRPISLNLDDAGLADLQLDLAIVYGETQVDIIRDLKAAGLVLPDVVKIYDKRKATDENPGT